MTVVVWSDEALIDLAIEMAELEARSERAARQYVDRITKATRQLAEFPGQDG